ncbi:MAG: cytochrome ubiquinol oxidase subunit I [Actinobacteria bacterium]|nr:cytochrome ubiquinol oxidase subunit I [Actinomycetota bacterium]
MQGSSVDTFMELSRLQFAMTTLFHYLFVPLTLGLAPIVAFFETMHYRTRNPVYVRLATFFGSLLIINFAMGVVSGIVQEFQFGMNWSVYSAFVGDIFGGPLAMEGILAFFLESTFLGLWVFGRNKLPRGLHLASIWLVALGTWASAFFIITANSWMQHPVGYEIDPETGRAVLADPVAVFTQDIVWWSWLHAVLGGLVAASVFVFAVAAYHLKRRQHVAIMKWTFKFAIVLGIIAGASQALVGDTLGVVMTEKQPMKIAAAEAVWETTGPCAGLSIVAWPDQAAQDNVFDIEIPCLLSIVATNSLDGEVTGMTELQAEYEQEFGPGNYIPNVWVAFYSFRLMMGFGLVGVGWMLVAAWATRKGRLPTSRAFWAISIWIVATPWLGNMFGWIFTENGRQPWIVYGELKTADASSGLSPGLIITSLVVFALLYGSFAVIEFFLIRKYAIKGPPDDATVPVVKEMVGS